MPETAARHHLQHSELQCIQCRQPCQLSGVLGMAALYQAQLQADMAAGHWMQWSCALTIGHEMPSGNADALYASAVGCLVASADLP